MKKYILIFMCSLLFACNSSNDAQEIKYKSYNDFKNKILANSGKDSYSLPFRAYLEIIPLANDTYSYTVFIDEPRIAMYQIQMMALDPIRVKDDKMEPNLGILEDEVFNLVPNQVYVDKGYPKGIALNGTVETSSFSIFVGISFSEENQNQTMLFFSFKVENGEVINDEVEYE